MIFSNKQLLSFQIITLLYIFLCLCSCQRKTEKWKAQGRTVEVVKNENGFQLLRNGEPYFIKGAGAYTHYKKIKEHGGNSIRVWDTNDAERILDQAHQLGLTVNLGIWLTREKEGFNFDDKKAVEQQLEQIRRQVEKYKDHPALLMWNIGNEMNAGSTNVRVWDVINQIAKMIHTIDPNHPVSTSLMDVPYRTIRFIKSRCPELDILSINTYGGVASLPDEIRKSAWDGPYIISEYGAKGYWEVPLTSWDAPYEQNSSQKARFIKEKYGNFILQDKERCLGSYVFLWGEKQEKTHTWFNLFSAKGEKTESVDVLQNLWTGTWPENLAPRVKSFRIDGKETGNIKLAPGSIQSAEIEVKDAEGDSLTYYWEVLPEIEVNDGAVDRLRKPDSVAGSIVSYEGATVRWQAPQKDGPYRIFVKVSDGHENMATANIPFLVDSTDTIPLAEREEIKSDYIQRLINYFSN